MLIWRKNTNFSFRLLKANIIELPVEVIVNAANSQLKLGTGIAGALKSKCGETLQDDCNNYVRKHGEVKPGDVAVTGKGDWDNPKLKYIYHAVGPIWNEGKSKEDLILKTCFDNILHRASKGKVNSIAIPLISTGVFRFPKDLASRIYLNSLDGFAKGGYSYPKEIITPILDEETHNIFLTEMINFHIGKEIDYKELNAL